MLRAAEDPDWADGRPDIDPEGNPGWLARALELLRRRRVSDAPSGCDPFHAGPLRLTLRSRRHRTARAPARDRGDRGPGGPLVAHRPPFIARAHAHGPRRTADGGGARAHRRRQSNRLKTGAVYISTPAFGLAATFGTPELLAIIERAANDPEAPPQWKLLLHRDRSTGSSREPEKPYKPGFVPSVICTGGSRYRDFRDAVAARKRQAQRSERASWMACRATASIRSRCS